MVVRWFHLPKVVGSNPIFAKLIKPGEPYSSKNSKNKTPKA